MARIVITAPSGDLAPAEALRQALLKQIKAYSLTVIDTDDPQIAQRQIAAADVVIIVISPDWATQLDPQSAHYAALETALAQSNVLVLNALINDARIPAITELPQALRAVAYMSAQPLAAGDAYPRSVRLLAEPIVAFFRETEGKLNQTTTQAPQQAKSGGGIPVNIVITVTVLFLAAVAILVPRLREANTTEATPTPDAVESADNPAITEISLGLAAGLTQVRGEEMLRGAQLALEDRPEVTIDGSSFPVDLLSQDTNCAASGGLNIARLFVSSPSIAGVIGHQCDTSCAASAQIYTQAGYSSVSPACTVQNLSDNNSFFRTVPADSTIGMAAADLVTQAFASPRVVVIYDEMLSGQAIAQGFSDAYPGEIINAYVVETLTLSIPDLADDIVTDAPDLVFIAGRARNAAGLREALDEHDLTDIPLFYGGGDANETLIEQDTASIAGIYTGEVLPPSGEAVTTLADRYEETYLFPPTSPIFAYSYDATIMLIDAIEATASINEAGTILLDREALREYLEGYTNSDAITGELDCSAQASCATAELALYRVIAGALTEVSNDE